ncbi:MFS general substrate transporter [Cadophora sp. DSE1049]|nr:MFS general substrate transporter [Cadophora sp. DSE1049]
MASKEVSDEVENVPNLDRTRTIDVDNYHGLNTKIILVYLASAFIVAAQVMNLVGAGTFARDIAAVVGGSSESVWLSQVIAILTCVVGPPVSQAADYWGRKWFISILTAFGFVGSIVVSRATSMNMAIAGQVICGVAYGAQPLVYAVASEILPRKFRPAAQGGVNIALGLGGIFGLLTGSALSKNSPQGFRTFWYIVGGILGLAAILFAVLYTPPPRQLQATLTNAEKLRQLDWIGYGFLMTGVVLFSMGLSWAQNPYKWTDAHVLAPLVAGAVLLICLVVYETWFKRDGMFNHELFKRDRNFGLALGCFFADGIVFFAANAYFGMEMSILFETDPLRVGLRFCMLFFAAMPAAAFVSVYSSATRDIRSPIIGFFVLATVFFICMATATIQSSTAAWIYMALLGLGTGLGLTCIVTAAQLSAPPDLIAISSGLVFSVRSLGGSIALAIYNAIFRASLDKHMGKGIASAVIPLGLSPSVLPDFITALTSQNQKALMSIPTVSPQIIKAGAAALKQAYLVSFRGVWIAAGVLSFVTLIASCFFINPKKDLNMHVDAPLDDN